MSIASRIHSYLQAQQPRMLEFLERLVRVESPSMDATAQAPAFAIMIEALAGLGFRTQHIAGRFSGGHLYAYPRERKRGALLQLLLGHVDTVWPQGTLKEMPLEIKQGRMSGPGVYDMKGGLTQMIFALEALQRLDLKPTLTPLILLNSDEEIGSRESTPYIRRWARIANRAYVLEPSLGEEGWLKTARKGVGRFTITVRGKAAHAGLNPEQGNSAILELAYQIQSLFALNDPAAGVAVNVSMIDGGLLPSSVVAPVSRAVVDVHAPTREAAGRVEQAIRELSPQSPGVKLVITGGMVRPPMERTQAGDALWALARSLGRELGIELQHATVGDGSDGNTTSQFTATLDGLGAVGDGVHAQHECIFIDKLVERSSLLALLLLAPSL